MGEMPHNFVPELAIKRDNFGNPRDGDFMIAKNFETKQHMLEKTVKPKIGSSSRCENCLRDVGGSEMPALKADELRVMKVDDILRETESRNIGNLESDRQLRIPRTRVFKFSLRCGLEL
ncbi:hypothetical protein BWQ96_10219 [Gracilariopsis chorda]|uniref:Uncharacterized protein n=1 Tax=Gracilariopsis chorda TaxID=448386 RepID=A0A2V3IDF7_9FLOR|nr:hypothetical protein BWQ96_10219 [Gracilariopsis chorda]|eukprot:PXF40068.1 hypothetical protein BWQ96_10219 [Gracilariopsis chorda]